jgi:outer membrane lipoprotein-sorting protein
MNKIITAITMVLLAGIGTGATALTGTEIIKKAEDSVRGNTAVAQYRITIKTRRWERTMVLRAWDSRKGNRGFSEILSPERDAGNRFLMLDKTMWHYVPKLQKEYKISPSMMMQSWMGSDFSNDDIIKESSITEDYTHALEGQVTVGGEACYRITLTPKPEAPVVWGKIVYYARVKDCLPVKEEYYNERGVMKKFMEFGDFKQMHDRMVPARMKMQTVGKEGQYTLMEIDSIKFNVPIPERVFSLQNLQRR